MTKIIGKGRYATETYPARGPQGPQGPPGPSASTYNVVETSVAYLAAPYDFVICDTSGGGFAVTLPSAIGISGKSLVVKKVSPDGNELTLASSLAQTIDGETSQVWSDQHASMNVVSDGANWQII